MVRSSATRADRVNGRCGRPRSSRTGAPSPARNRDGWSASPFGTRHRSYHQPGPGTSARDVEEPPLLRDAVRAGNCWQHLVATQPIRLQQRAAAAYVWPTTFLDPRYDDEVPLQPFGSMGREDTDRRPPELDFAAGSAGIC
mgnify:CR=1 FL=1